MKKRMFVLGLVIVMLVSLTSCKKSDDVEVSENEVTNSKEEVVSGKVIIWAWDPNFTIPILEEAKTRYKNENVEIEIVDMATTALDQKLQTALASGSTDILPDIILIEDYNVQKYLNAFPDTFVDLTGKIKHSDFAQYKVDLMTHDGKIYGVPFDSGVAGMYYRSDILEEAGFTHEDMTDITWNRYIEIGKEVKEKTGKEMLGFDPNDGSFMRIMMQSSGSWYFDENGKPDLANNEALIEAANIYSELVKSEIAKPTNGWGDWVGAFNSGEVATVISGVWITGSIKAVPEQSGKWKVAPVPRLELAGSKNVSNLGGSSFYVLNNSESVDAAIDFINKTLASDVDFYQTILKNQGAISSYLPAREGEAYKAADEFFGGQEVYMEFTKWMQDIPSVNFGMYTREADSAIFSVFNKIFEGEDVSTVLEEAQEALEALIN